MQSLCHQLLSLAIRLVGNSVYDILSHVYGDATERLTLREALTRLGECGKGTTEQRLEIALVFAHHHIIELI